MSLFKVPSICWHYRMIVYAAFLPALPWVSRAQSLSHDGKIIEQKAADFVRNELDDSAKVEWIRKSGNLSGKGPESGVEQAPVTGWVEYDFSVVQPGWYGLSVQPDGASHEFLLDGKHRFYGAGSKVANVWLDAGQHTLRIQRGIWTGFGKITDWQLASAGEEPSERISVRTTNPWKVIRKGETLPVTVSYGDLAAPVKLSLLVRERANPDVIQTVEVDLPAGGGLHEAQVVIPGARQGVYEVSYQLDGVVPKSTALPTMMFAVVDTNPVVPVDGAVGKRLVAEIDVAKQAPDYFKGGETRVVNKPWGSYRESGDVGYLQHMNSTEPSWFAYKFQVQDPNALYWMEFDYPDDARRSFMVVPRSRHSLSYAGPGTGPDTGREYSLTNRMQTMGIYFWPHDTDLRAAVLQPQTGLRAAVSKIRIYKVEGPFTPMPHAKGGREFIHWYEEGSSFLGFFGAENKNPESVIVAADNWARVMASMGASMLMPTLSIYQMGMYPSAFNREFTDSNAFDAARVIELVCERYGLKFAAEFHPEGRGLNTASALSKSQDSIYQFDRFGKVWAGGEGPKFNFLNPLVENFAMGLVGEFVDRYGDSAAFEGVSIRLMGWQNTGLGNFGDLNWGYGDYTIALYEKDTKTKLPVAGDDPDRFEKRYQWLMANAKDQWINWRCQKATEFFAKLSDRLREKHPEARLFLDDFLTPSPDTSKAWYEGFRNTLPDAGIDPARLAALPGVELLNSTVSYGRRNSEAKDQRLRDALLNPSFLRVAKQDGKPAGFLTTQAYFEATEAIAPPVDMGYPANTPHGWMSGSANPAGRNYLERFALPLAESDAAILGDGGNGYTVGQPLLREFLKEYRALPWERFQAREDARDPVAVWERDGTGDFLFYAVNRERYPVKMEVEFSATPEIKRLATGEKVPTDGKMLQFELQPYELRSFSAAAGTKIEKVTEIIPEAELVHLKKMTEWLRRLSDDVGAGTTGADLTPAQKSFLSDAATEAETCLKEGRTWRARTLQEDQRLREIYSQCVRIPTLLDQNGPQRIPEGALSGTKLAGKVTSKKTSLIASEKVTREWTGQQVIISSGGELTFGIKAPFDGLYQIGFGQVVGDGFSDSSVTINGKPYGVLKSSPGEIHCSLAMLPTSVSLTKGKHAVSLVASNDKRQGLLFVNLIPVYQDVVANRWMVAGPFFAADRPEKEATGAEIEEAMKNKEFPPEWDVSAKQGASDLPWKWQRIGGLEDFVDFKKLTGMGSGSIHYAMTTIVSPVERDVMVSFSSDYYAKMWLNGTVVLDSYHPGGHPEKGQLKMNLHLNEGPNTLLLKVASGSGGNGFWFAVNNPGDLRFVPMGSTPKSHPENKPTK